MGRAREFYRWLQADWTEEELESIRRTGISHPSKPVTIFGAIQGLGICIAIVVICWLSWPTPPMPRRGWRCSLVRAW